MRFIIDDKHLIKWVRVKKNYAEKCLLEMVFGRRWSIDGDKDTYQISVQDL